MSTKIAIAKHAVNFIVGAGAAKVTRNIITNNSDPETLTEKVEVAAASLAMGMMVAEHTQVYASRKIDEYTVIWNDIRNRKDSE